MREDLFREIEVSLSPNIISEKLRYIGSNWSAQREFFWISVEIKLIPKLCGVRV